MDKKELQMNFGGAEKAVSEMEKVFKQHEQLETVIVNPDSWVGKELLMQSKRLIDLRHELCAISATINRLERKIDKLEPRDGFEVFEDQLIESISKRLRGSLGPC